MGNIGCKLKTKKLAPEWEMEKRQGRGGSVTWKGITWMGEERVVRENDQPAMGRAFIYPPHGRGPKQRTRHIQQVLGQFRNTSPPYPDKLYLGWLEILGFDVVPWT